MLKVERIVLQGFTGMGLHEIAKFDFTITTPVTIVLGGNGCGKTTMLSVFLPLCPAKTDIRDGGEYTNYSLVDQTRYRFNVRRKGSSLLCSIENLTLGEMLVTDVNPKVYNTHVETITGLTKELKEMLNGELELTRAATPLRKTWFTRLSTSDLGTALNFYTKLRKHYNALGNQIDYLTGKIADSKNRVVEDQEARERLERRMEFMQNDINTLNRVLDMRPATNSGITLESIRQKLERMRPTIEAILSGDVIPTVELITQENRLLSQGKEWVARAEGDLAAYTKELSLLKDEENRQAYLMRSHVGLQTTIRNIEEQLVVTTNRLKMYPDLFDVTQFTPRQLQDVVGHASEFTTSLTQKIDGLRTTHRLKDAEAILLDYDQRSALLQEKIGRCAMVIGKLKHAMEHFHATAEVNCPKCDFHFRPGVTYSIEKVSADLTENERYAFELDNEMVVLLQERKEIEDEVLQLRGIRAIVMTYSRDPVLSLLFKKLQEMDAFVGHRGKFGGIVTAFFDELEIAQTHLRLTGQLETARREWMEASASVNGVDVGLGDRIRELEGKMHDATQTLSTHRQYVADKTQYVSRLTVLETSIGTFKRFQEEFQREVEVSTNNLVIEHFSQMRENKLDAFATARDRYRQMQTEMDQLAKMEAELAQLQLRRHTTKQLIAVWSPEAGILRDYYYSAVVRIADMMSHYIDQIWMYPMQVQACDLEDGDMDYLFPVKLKDHDELVPDVSKGSKAQRAIFNLTYRLTCYKALGLQNYPLLLDEPSEGMDEAHRGRLVDFIKRLYTSGEFSQVIIVSHDSDVHSKLNEAAYCVVEPEGVTLPDVYNEHVRIEYAEA